MLDPHTKQYCTVDELTFKLANRATLAPAKIADAIFYAILSGEFDGHLLHKCGFPDYRSEDLYKGYVASRAQADQKFKSIPLSQFVRMPHEHFSKGYGQLFREGYIDQLALEERAVKSWFETRYAIETAPSKGKRGRKPQYDWCYFTQKPSAFWRTKAELILTWIQISLGRDRATNDHLV